jgi:ATP-dependent RNA helicase DeaD
MEVLNVQLEGRRINVEISKNDGGGRRDHNGRSSGGGFGGSSSEKKRRFCPRREGSVVDLDLTEALQEKAVLE